MQRPMTDVEIALRSDLAAMGAGAARGMSSMERSVELDAALAALDAVKP